MDALDMQWKMMVGMRRMKEQTDKALQPFCDRYGLTPVQLQILMTLAREGPMTVSTLARRVCMADGNSSALCKRLAAAGFVSRQRDEADERQVVISLSSEGCRLTKELCIAGEASMQELTGRFSREEAETIMYSLDKLITVLEEEKETVV